MAKTIKTIILFITLLVSHVVQGDPGEAIENAELNYATQVLLRLPEGRALWEEVTREGPVKVVGFTTQDPFEAYWEGTSRRIFINLKERPTWDQAIASIIFELHNAKANRQINELHQRAIRNQIGQEEFVVAMERIEWNNINQANALLDKGIRQGVYPARADLPRFNDFDDYMDTQRVMGHNDHHRKSYRQLRSWSSV